MTLLTAHRILIGTAILFFFFLSFWELNNYFQTGSPWAGGRAALYLIVAGGFSVYLKFLRRWYH